VNPEQEKSIFADPRGVRRRILQVVVFFSALFLLVAAGSFIWGLLIRPQLTLPSIVRNYRASSSGRFLRRNFPFWIARITGGAFRVVSRNRFQLLTRPNQNQQGSFSAMSRIGIPPRFSRWNTMEIS
jgi:hypothetical protein